MAMPRWLATAAMLLALLVSLGCARPPSQAIVVPVSGADWSIMGEQGEALEPSACRKLCAATGQDQPADRCYMARGWDYHQQYWMVCHYGADR